MRPAGFKAISRPKRMPPAPTRFLVVGDIGGSHSYHAGDEAMLEANLLGLRRLRPASEFVVPSRDPGWTSSRYGVDSIPVIDPGAPLPEFDVAFISGGGNLCSSWPDLFGQRIAVLKTALARGKRALVVGQTIGPHLEPLQRAALAEALSRASLVGVREHYSLELVRGLGVPEDRVLFQLDDAFFLPNSNVSCPDRYVALTIHECVRPDGTLAPLGLLARRLEEFAQATECRYLFLPHQHFEDPPIRDVSIANGLLRHLPDGLLTISGCSAPRDVARLTRGAEMVVSTRYHPIVFGLSGFVPGIGLHFDEYTRVKLSGALAHGGMGPSLSLSDLLEGKAIRVMMEIWQRRARIRSSLEARKAAWLAMESEKWKRIETALAPAA